MKTGVPKEQWEKIADALRGRYQCSGNDPFNIPAHAQLGSGNIGRSRLNLERPAPRDSAWGLVASVSSRAHSSYGSRLFDL